MTVAQLEVFRLTLAELAVLLAFVGYVVSLIKDWRPVRTLRNENQQLRQMLEQAERDRAADKTNADKRISELEAEVAHLSRATDVTSIAQKQDATVELLRSLVTEVKALDGAVRANTAAVETLSKRRIIDEALNEREPLDEGDPK